MCAALRTALVRPRARPGGKPPPPVHTHAGTAMAQPGGRWALRSYAKQPREREIYGLAFSRWSSAERPVFVTGSGSQVRR